MVSIVFFGLLYQMFSSYRVSEDIKCNWMLLLPFQSIFLMQKKLSCASSCLVYNATCVSLLDSITPVVHQWLYAAKSRWWATSDTQAAIGGWYLPPMHHW